MGFPNNKPIEHTTMKQLNNVNNTARSNRAIGSKHWITQNMTLRQGLMLFFVLFNLTSFAQNKVIRIGPPCPKPKPDPAIVYDGVRIPSKVKFAILNNKLSETIDSLSIQMDSIYDCSGTLTNVGFVKIYSKDSLNLGAKKILALTNNCLYDYPLTKLTINKEEVEWDEETYYNLIGLKPEDIVKAKVKVNKKNTCERTLNLTIKE